MTFLFWRLHRAHAVVSAVVMVAIIAFVVPTGTAIATSYHQAVLSCSVRHIGCNLIDATVFGSNGVFTALVRDLTMAVPLVFGILWGAPLVASEFEANTEDFAWTQGVTRRRWVLTNLGWALLVATAWGGALAGLFSWWQGPSNTLIGPVTFIYFDVQGVAPIAYTIFAMALGIAAGAFFRRIVPAIMTTLIAFIAVRIAIALYFRPLFAVTKIVSAVSGSPPLSYSVSQDILGGTHTASCKTLACMAAHGARNHITYVPANQFWPLQGAESGIYLALALALALFTYWSVTTREA